MPTISSIAITIKAITAPFSKGLNKAINAITSFSGAIIGLIATIAKLAIALTVTVGGALIGIGLMALKSAANFEALEKGFVTLLGSAAAASKRFEELKKFAAVTPFEVKDIAKASKVLQVLTKGALASGDGLRMVGDAAAVANQPIAQIALHIGRVNTALREGGVFGESGRRLQEVGLISENTLTRIRALNSAGEKGAHVWDIVAEDLKKTSGAMLIMSRTTTGLFSTFKDNLNIALAEFGKLLQPIAKVLLQEAITKFQQLQKWIIKNKDALQEFLLSGIEKIAPIIIQIGNVGAAVFSVLFDAFSKDGPKSVDSFLMAIQKFFIKVEFVIRNFPEAWSIAWDRIILNTKAIIADIVGIVLTPFKIIGVNIVQSFKTAFKLVTTAVKFATKEIKLRFERAMTFDKKKLKNLDKQITDLVSRKRAAGQNIFANFDFIDFTDLATFEKELVKTTDAVRKFFGAGSKEFDKLNKRTAKFKVLMEQFTAARIAGNKDAATDFLAKIRALIEAGKNLGEGIAQPMVDAAEEIKKIRDVPEPTLALRGSQAAGRGELGLIGKDDEILKVNKEQLIEQKKLNANLMNNPLGNVIFGM